MQYIQQLSFVFMNAFNLHIKHGISIKLDTTGICNQFSQSLFVGLFYRKPFLVKLLIIWIDTVFKVVDMIQISHPFITYLLSNQLCHLRVGSCNPAPGCDTIGFIIKFIWPQFIEIFK